MSMLACRLTNALVSAGVPITGVSIGDDTNPKTWLVHPHALQATAQPIIDSFNPNDPVIETQELDVAVKAALDTERLISAVVWTVIDTYSAPATVAKYQAARTKIIAAYKSTPWKG